jgi:hypothetical protein
MFRCGNLKFCSCYFSNLTHLGVSLHFNTFPTILTVQLTFLKFQLPRKKAIPKFLHAPPDDRPRTKVWKPLFWTLGQRLLRAITMGSEVGNPLEHCLMSPSAKCSLGCCCNHYKTRPRRLCSTPIYGRDDFSWWRYQGLGGFHNSAFSLWPHQGPSMLNCIRPVDSWQWF